MSSIPETRRACRWWLSRLPVATLALLLSLPAGAEARQDVPGVAAGLRVVSVVGRVVTLAWEAPADGAAPTGYVLSGGAVPGETLATVPVPGPSTSFTFTAPIGTWYIRIHAQCGDVLGPPGEDLPLVVGAPLPPATPRSFWVMVGPGSVSLNWSSNPDGGLATGVVLLAAGTLTGAVPLDPTERIAFSGVPPGPYTLSLVAVNEAGASAPTGAVEILVPESTDDTSAPEAIEASSVQVRYQPLDAARLDELAGRERLAEVAAGASEWDRMLALKDWTAAQFAEGDPDPYPPWDAMTILDWIRGGVTGGFCGQYSQVLLQALASQGYTARYVEVGSIDNPYSHYVIEAWSNQFEKWVMLDADYNLHFERAGVPQSVLEVHDALVEGRAGELQAVRGAVLDGHPSAAGYALRTAELYYYVRLHLKADHLSAWQEASFDRYNDMVEWADARVVPWETSAVPSPYAKERLTRYRTFDRAVFDAPLNSITASAAGTPDGTVRLEVRGGMLQLGHYEFRERRADGASADWQSFSTDAVDAMVSVDAVALEVRGVNVRGVAGPARSVPIATQR